MMTLAWLCVWLAALIAFERLVHIVAFITMMMTRGASPEMFGYPQTRRLMESTPIENLASMVATIGMDNPSVLIQLPIFNEGSQAPDLIRSIAMLDWPVDLMLVQILDDSTDKGSRECVNRVVDEWQKRGIPIEIHRRTNRQGYKAGALKEGMELPHVKDRYEFIAIFDADFRPMPDFLLQTVPYFGCGDVGVVQARWTFTNASESFLTRMQEIALNYHCKCEQFSRFAAHLFFNFNGTAGVWRTRTIIDAGGWSGSTVTEDMDLSLRAHLAGWKAVFLRNVGCDSEIPTDYRAYRNQQFRWTCGPMQVWRRINVWKNFSPFEDLKPVDFIRRLWITLFFLVSYLLSNSLTAILAVILIPMSVLFPDVLVPITLTAILLLPATLATCLFTPTWRVDRYLGFILFQNVMSLLRIRAIVSGLLDTQRANSWIVTAKKGSAASGTTKRKPSIYSLECVVGGIYFVAAAYTLLNPFTQLWYEVGLIAYLCLQGIVFICHGAGFFQLLQTNQVRAMQSADLTRPVIALE
jgi:beta-mannan synthase